MRTRKKINSIDSYKTLTTKLEIIEALLDSGDSDFEELFQEENLELKLKTENGDVFKQTIDKSLSDESVFQQLVLALDLDIENKKINDKLLLGKQINAIIATKSKWSKAFIVAIF